VVPEHIAKKNNVIPVRKDNNVLFVAMADTNNLQAQDSLRLVSRCQIRPVLAVPDHIEEAVNRKLRRRCHRGGHDRRRQGRHEPAQKRAPPPS